MTAIQLLALSVLASVAVAGLGLALGRLLEPRLFDPALRERLWRVALYLPAVPVAVMAVALSLPARVVVVAETSSQIAAEAAIASAAPAAIAAAGINPVQAGATAVLALALLLLIARVGATALRLLRLRRIMAAATPAPAALQTQVAEAARRMAVAAPRVRILPLGSEAFLSGLRRPVLVLPAALVAAPDPSALSAVCAHELAHLRRGDHLALWLEEALLTVLAVNPLLATLRRRRAAAREEACDALALAGADAPTRRAYARTLLAALRSATGPTDVPALTFTPSKRTFAMHRLQAILTPTSAAAPRMRGLTAALGLVVTAGVCTASVALAAQREPILEQRPTSKAEQPLKAAARPTPAARAIAAAPPAAPATAPEATGAPILTPVAVPTAAPAAAPMAAPAPTPSTAPAQSSTALSSTALWTETERPAVINNPGWAQHPTPVFPQAAIGHVSEGRVTLDCTAQPDGRLGACTTVRETPAGYGFGQAALDAVARARISPRTIDAAAPGARVVFSVVFRLSAE